MKHLRIIILGCGSSGGVPRLGIGWGACDPKNPKNHRRRSGLLVEQVDHEQITGRLLIDSSPDLRQQLIETQVSWLDGILYTHDHADHVHGIDELRPLAQAMKQKIPAFADPATAEILRAKFNYCFQKPFEGSLHDPILSLSEVNPYETLNIKSNKHKDNLFDLHLFDQIHGPGRTLGFRLDDFTYATDVSDFPDKSLDYLKGLDLLILGCLRYTHHPSHFTLEKSLQIIEAYKPKHTILTHLHVDFDYETLKAELPKNVEPAYDGMVIELPFKGA